MSKQPAFIKEYREAPFAAESGCHEFEVASPSSEIAIQG
jgi:hypothetical protein